MCFFSIRLLHNNVGVRPILPVQHPSSAADKSFQVPSTCTFIWGMPSHLADFAQQQQQQQEPTGSFRRPRVKVVDGRAFVYDAASAATLLSEHRIWATPVGVRHVMFSS